MRSLSLNPGFPMGSKDIRNGGQVVKLPDYGRGGLSVPGYAGCTGTRTRRRLSVKVDRLPYPRYRDPSN
jgi:hypothetical protein